MWLATTTAASEQRLPPVGGRCRIATKRGVQGGVVGAAASKTQVPPKARRGCWVPQAGSSGGHFKSSGCSVNHSGAAFYTAKNQPCSSCNPVANVVQYLSTQKGAPDSACGVVRHTDAGPVRWARCEPGQVGNQAALSSAFVRFSKPASVCRVTQGGDKTPSSAVLLFLPQRPGKGRHRRVSCTLPQMETPAV